MLEDVIEGRGAGDPAPVKEVGGVVEADRRDRSEGAGLVEAGPVKPGRTGGSQDRIFGLVGGLMILAALYLFINSLVGTPEVSDSPPQVELVAPANGDTLSLPLQLRFRSAQPLSMQPGGWGANNFHLHVEAAGLELMPGANDIRPAASDEYVWTIGTLPFGETTLRLFWADVAHRPVVGGASDGVRVLIR